MATEPLSADLSVIVGDLQRPGVSRAEALADRLGSAILDNSLPPGHRLGTKSDLQHQTGVALGTLNEALRVLQIRGLVEVRPGPGGGFFVARQLGAMRLRGSILRLSRDARAVADCFTVRNTLDPLVAEEAARACTPADAAELRAHLSEMVAASDDPPRSLMLNWALHRKIAEIGSNAVLTAVYCSLLDFLTDASAELEPASSSIAPDTIRVHAELVEAIASGDVERARAAAELHSADRQPAELEAEVPGPA